MPACGVDFGRPAAEARAIGAARSAGPVVGLSPCHAHERVAPCCGSQQDHLVFLASSMTASLQPLGAFVFASLKRHITHTYERLVLEGDGEKCTERFVIELLHTASAYFFEQDWTCAFHGCGFGCGQTGLTKHLKSRCSAIAPCF